MKSDLVYFAQNIKSLSWRDMVKISEHIATVAKVLEKDNYLDRDGVAQALSDMADEIITAHEAESTAARSGGDT